MKTKIICPVVLLLVVGIINSCENSQSVQKDPAKITLNYKSEEIIQADQQFAFELLGKVNALSEEDNFMISPLSVSYALGMTMNGAAGKTLDAFYKVLHFGDLSNAEVNESYRDLIKQLVRLDDKVDFSIANSIWYKLGYNLLDEFINTNQTYFDAAVRELDFSDPEVVDIIVELRETSTGGDSTPIFRVDKPFLYIIKENSTEPSFSWEKSGNPSTGNKPYIARELICRCIF